MNMNIEQFLKTHYAKKTTVNLADLESRILQDVRARETKRNRIRSLFWAGLFVVSTIGFMVSSAAAYSQFGSSGARDLISVAISDSNMVFANGSEFVYSLVETMPLAPIASGFAAVALLLTALRHLVLNDRRNYFNKLNYGTR